MTTIHEGADHLPHAYLVVTHSDGTHAEVQLKDEDDLDD